MPQIATRDRRTYAVEIRTAAEGEQRRIEGHAAVFHVYSEEMWGFREIILPGAFRSALGKSDVRALYNHNPDHVLGRTKAGTLKVWEDERGLAVSIEPPDTQVARDLLVSIDRGDIDGMSFAFTVAKDRWIEDENDVVTREIVEIEQLYDVSPVTYPAYAATDLSLRSEEAYQEYQRQREAAGAAGPVANELAAGAAARERELRLHEMTLIRPWWPE